VFAGHGIVSGFSMIAESPHYMRLVGSKHNPGDTFFTGHRLCAVTIQSRLCRVCHLRSLTFGDAMLWIQRELHLPRFGKGFHAITRHVVEALPELKSIGVGLLHIFIQHTSASLTINEAADPDVADDLNRVFDHLAPEDFPYAHTVEGRDDMPAHVKTTLSSCSLVVPIRNGQLAMGTWQGIFLCEHRRHNSGRHLILTLFGEKKTE